MGLDMYLDKRVYVGANWNYAFHEVEGEINITKRGKKVDVNFNKVKYIDEECAYWRKANQIHNWFVNNVCDGVDDCSMYFYVPVEKLQELVKLCKLVLEDNSMAEKLLPTCEGFFFGSTEYNDDYYYELEHTIDMLDGLDEDAEYLYHASW